MRGYSAVRAVSSRSQISARIVATGKSEHFPNIAGPCRTVAVPHARGSAGHLSSGAPSTTSVHQASWRSQTHSCPGSLSRYGRSGGVRAARGSPCPTTRSSPMPRHPLRRLAAKRLREPRGPSSTLPRHGRRLRVALVLCESEVDDGLPKPRERLVAADSRVMNADDDFAGDRCRIGRARKQPRHNS
jgi:hypothetical protein